YMVTTPTSPTGTTIHHLYVWASASNRGRVNRDTWEFELKANTNYAIKLTADASTSAGHIILNWYEHTDRT
ncbi:unnamed protein product, partial [marine sediment metagenome]